MSLNWTLFQEIEILLMLLSFCLFFSKYVVSYLWCGSCFTSLDNLLSLVFCRHTVGDTKVPFCLQSCVKPLKYAVAVHDYSTEYVHSFIGKEPSGLRFNKLFLNEDGEPLDFPFSLSLLFWSQRASEKWWYKHTIFPPRNLVMETWWHFGNGESPVWCQQRDLRKLVFSIFVE